MASCCMPGRSSMALFTRTAKLDPAAHGARCAWAMAVHHAVGISRHRNSGYRPSRISIIAQGLSTPDPGFRFRICWYCCLQKVKVCEQTKFRRHISIDGWDITTSVFEKQTSAILEIYFRFRFRPFARNLHIILHQATDFFSKSKHPLRKYYVISISQDGGRDG